MNSKLKAFIEDTDLDTVTDIQTHYNLKECEIAHYVIEEVEFLD